MFDDFGSDFCPLQEVFLGTGYEGADQAKYVILLGVP